MGPAVELCLIDFRQLIEILESRLNYRNQLWVRRRQGHDRGDVQNIALALGTGNRRQ